MQVINAYLKPRCHLPESAAVQRYTSYSTSFTQSLYYLVFSYCLRIQYCTLGVCLFESVQLSSGGSDQTINAETSPMLLYWKTLKTNIREKSELKYLQLSFLLQSVHSASISAYQTSTDMWTVLWMESWDNRLFITCNHLYLYMYIIKCMQTFWHKRTPETCQSVPKLLLIHSLLLCRWVYPSQDCWERSQAIC